MNNTVGIFHGYGGNKPNSWLTWLSKNLRESGITTVYPSFPPMGSSTIEMWYEVLLDYKKDMTEPMTLVGHSAGTTFSFYVAQHSGLHFDKLILVCPLNDLNGADTSALIHKPEVQDQVPFIRAFVHQHFDFDLIKSHVKEFVFILSDNDPNVPYQETKHYFQTIFPTSRFTTLSHYGHVNEKAGITELPEVLNELNSPNL